MNHTVARRRILQILASPDSRIIHRLHAGDRQRERRVTAGEVHRILRCGAIVNSPHWDTKFNNWVCQQVEGPDQDGRFVRVVIGIWEDKLQIAIITVVEVE